MLRPKQAAPSCAGSVWLPSIPRDPAASWWPHGGRAIALFIGRSHRGRLAASRLRALSVPWQNPCLGGKLRLQTTLGDLCQVSSAGVLIAGAVGPWGLQSPPLTNLIQEEKIRRRSGKGESPERSGQKQGGRSCRLLAPAAPFLDPCLFCVSVSGAPQKSLAIERLLFVQDNTEINRGA